MNVVSNLESKEVKKEKKKEMLKEVKQNASQAKLSSAGTLQVTKHKQGLGGDKLIKS